MDLRTFYFLLAFVGATNALWFSAKFVLRSRGYPVSFFRHLQDLGHLRLLIASEPDPAARRRYSRLQTALYLSIAGTLASFAAFALQ